MSDYATLEPALALLAAYGPDLRNGLTSHAPMVVEALCALDRPDAVLPWLETYRRGMLPRPAPRTRITATEWRQALGAVDRAADWSAFFANEVSDAPWRDVVARWTAHLAPGLCASATHGVIRVGHAVRSLEVATSPARLDELAVGLGYWAANYQTLPDAGAPAGSLRPRDAVAAVRVVPPAERAFDGTITSSLAALDRVPDFAPVAALLDTRGDPGAVLSELTETFARVFLANAHDVLTAIVFVHAVTSAAAVRSLLPCLDQPTTHASLRYAWQAAAALYATFGTRPEPPDRVAPPLEGREVLVDLAIVNGDEHAIKFTEACLREHAHRPSAAYLAAARRASALLPAATYTG